MVPLILYTDDTSGNKSKQWNKFDLWYLKLAGFPNIENSKLHNVHFICCSNERGALDMSKPIMLRSCWNLSLMESLLMILTFVRKY